MVAAHIAQAEAGDRRWARTPGDRTASTRNRFSRGVHGNPYPPFIIVNRLLQLLLNLIWRPHCYGLYEDYSKRLCKSIKYSFTERFPIYSATNSKILNPNAPSVNFQRVRRGECRRGHVPHHSPWNAGSPVRARRGFPGGRPVSRWMAGHRRGRPGGRRRAPGGRRIG